MNTDRTKLKAYISGVYPMADQRLDVVANCFKYKEVSKHEFLLEEAKYCKLYYFLEEGFARAYTFNTDGEEVTIAFYSSNQIVCELYSFFKLVPAKESIQTLTDCKVWYLTYDEVQHAFHTYPFFREFGRSILVNAYAGLKLRMLAVLQQTAEKRYAELLENTPEIFRHAPLKYIASYLGITDTSLSRIRKEVAGN